MTRPPGSAIGRYQILGFMARGETTIVYEALEPELGRKVALKILPPSAARDTEGSDFFLRLAARLSVLDHTNLLPVIDYGREDGVPFMATPIAEGGSLAAHMEEFSQPKSALTLAASLALAVDYLHRNDVVHGRIGPGHILLDAEGAPLLTGFGRPYAPGDPGPMPAYLAPEQHQGQATDARTDIYQLGALLHHLLLGKPPDPDAGALVVDQEQSLDEDLLTILARALAFDPDDRFNTADELAGQLTLAAQRRPAPDQLLEPPPVPEPSQEAAPEAAHHEAPPAARDRNFVWLAAAVLGLAFILTLCCLMAIFAVYVVSGRQRQPQATAQVDTNVRVGPAIEYPLVGILRQGEQATIHGISPDGQWWQIAFDGAPDGKGWVPAVFVTVDQMGNVDVVEPPPFVPQAAQPRSPVPLFVVALAPVPV